MRPTPKESPVKFLVTLAIVFGVTLLAALGFTRATQRPKPPTTVAPGVDDDGWARRKLAAEKTVKAFPSEAPTMPQTPHAENAIPATLEDEATQRRRAEAVAVQFLDETIRLRQQFDEQMGALKIDRLLDAAVLIDPDSYGPARANLRTARRLLDDFETAGKREIDRTSARMRGLNLRKDLKESILAEAEPVMAECRLRIEKSMALERQRLEGLTALLDFVEPRLEQMRVVDGALICDKPQDDAELLGRLRQLAANRQQRLAFNEAANPSQSQALKR